MDQMTQKIVVWKKYIQECVKQDGGHKPFKPAVLFFVRQIQIFFFLHVKFENYTTLNANR